MKKALIRVLLKVVSDLIERKVKRILNKDISKKEIYFRNYKIWNPILEKILKYINI